VSLDGSDAEDLTLRTRSVPHRLTSTIFARVIRPRTRALFRCICGAAVAAMTGPSFAGEQELEEGPPATSVPEIQTPTMRMIPTEPEPSEALVHWLSEQLDQLPPFFADTRLEVRFRTYYLDKDRTNDERNEAWAAGGSLYYSSGWLEELLQLEVEGFTSQPVIAPDSRPGTLLLEPVQNEYTVLGIANAKLRYRGLVLTGFRQYLDLPYLNRQDNRMTPTTFEAITLAKPEGEFRFLGGYAWRIKQRNSEDFVSFAEALGLEEDRGSAYAGAIWEPQENFHVGAYAGAARDLGARVYGELGVGRDFAYEWHARIDAQSTYVWDIGDDLAGDFVDDTWNFAIRAAASRAGAVFRLGVGVAGPNAPDRANFGSTPSYVDLMQRTFNAPREKAVLVSVSYDFSELGADGLSAVANFAAGFDAKSDSGGSEAQEVDVTVDYRPKRGWLRNIWLRIRGSWLHQSSAAQDGVDVRVILRYDFQVI
jgi:hypothetical protein